MKHRPKNVLPSVEFTSKNGMRCSTPMSIYFQPGLIYLYIQWINFHSTNYLYIQPMIVFIQPFFICVMNYSCIQQIRIKQKVWPRKFPYVYQNAKLTNLVSKCSARFLESLRHFDTRKLCFKGLNLLQRDFITWCSNCTAF